MLPGEVAGGEDAAGCRLSKAERGLSLLGLAVGPVAKATSGVKLVKGVRAPAGLLPAAPRVCRYLPEAPRLVSYHVFPQAREFADLWQGIPIHQYCIRVPEGEHRLLHSGRGLGGDWNRAWREFFAENRGAPPDVIWREAEKILERFNLAGRPYVPYR